MTSFRKLLKDAFEARDAPKDLDVDSVLKFIHVLDFDPAGALREVAESRLENALDLPETAPAAFRVIERECQNAMTARGRLDASRIRSALDAAGTPVKARNESLLETQIAIRDVHQELLAGQRDILRAFTGTPPESPIVTREAKSILREQGNHALRSGSIPRRKPGV